MSDAGSLPSLSEVDYDTIADAVMETARGRWFLDEYAKRNRRADTNTVLAAIARLEQAFGVAARAASPVELADTDLDVVDLDPVPSEARIPETAPSARPGHRIQRASETILTAAETIQEAAWTLREAGADAELCDRLDRRATDIYAAVGDIDALAEQLGHLPGRSAPLSVIEPVGVEDAAHEAPRTLTPFADIEMVEADTFPAAMPTENLSFDPSTPQRFVGAHSLDDDIVFAEMLDDVAVTPGPAAPARSESDLRAIDALPVEERLKFFA